MKRTLTPTERAALKLGLRKGERLTSKTNIPATAKRAWQLAHHTMPLRYLWALVPLMSKHSKGA